MQQIILDNFSGGQNEVLTPREFSNGQWHQLIGMVGNEDGRVETQPAVQRIGSFPSSDHFYKVHAINTSIGTYLIAITRLGRIYWCKAPFKNAVYTTANAVSWTRLTTAENYNWSSTSAGTVKETIVDNPYLHFLSDIPVKAHLYVQNPTLTTNETARQLEYDTDTANGLNTGQFPGVLLSYRIDGGLAVSSPSQVLMVYVNTKETNTALQVKALVFPNMRRVPTFNTEEEDAGKNEPAVRKHFINGLFLYGKSFESGTQAEDVASKWPFGLPSDAPSVRMHPYGYNNVDGANLSGTGIIPRSGVACSIGGKLLLGDIEWRSKNDSLPKIPNTAVTIASLTTTAQAVVWPTDAKGLQDKGRVVYNNGDGTAYLSKDPLTDAKILLEKSVGVARASKSGSTITINLKKVPDPPAGWDTVKITGVGPNFNGVFNVSTDATALVGTELTYTFNRSGSPTNITNGKKQGKVTFFNATSDGAFSIEIPAGDYAALPNDDAWNEFYAVSDSTATIAALRDRLVARSFLNDSNTGRFGNGIYFSIEDMDQFNPTAEIEVSRGGANIAGMHVVDSTAIVVTEAGGETDGVYRIRGSFDLEQSGDPTALKVELVKGGIGVYPYGNYKNRNRRSCLWPDVGVVVFVDRLGGIWTTDGNMCDRIDRIGPTLPIHVVQGMLADVCAVGKHLFVRRNGGPSPFGSLSLYCFTVTQSDGSNAQGMWTQISLSTYPRVVATGSVPAGAINHMQLSTGLSLISDFHMFPHHMAAGQDDLYFVGVLDAGGQSHTDTIFIPETTTNANISGGNIYRLALHGPDAERGRLDNVPVIQIMQTPTLASDDEYSAFNWHTVATSFISRGETNLLGFFCAPFSAYPHNTGSFGEGGMGATFSSGVTPSANHYYGPYKKIVREFKQPALMGNAKMFSYRLYFQGDVVLQSVSVTTTGDLPTNGRSL